MWWLVSANVASLKRPHKGYIATYRQSYVNIWEQGPSQHFADVPNELLGRKAQQFPSEAKTSGKSIARVSPSSKFRLGACVFHIAVAYFSTSQIKPTRSNEWIDAYCARGWCERCPRAGQIPARGEYQQDNEKSTSGERENREGRKGNSSGMRIRVHQLHHKRVSVCLVQPWFQLREN